MRALAIPLALAVIAAIVLIVIIVIRGAEKPSGPTRWVVDTELKNGVTRVLIRHMAGEQELGRQVIKEIADDAEDWDARYHEAIAEARSRAAALSTESG